MNLNENLNEELIEALKNIYPIRANLRESLMETYNEELLDKLNALNKMIDNAEIIISKTQDVKKFYAEQYPEYTDESNNINERGINRISILKKKWKKLGYLTKNL
tara:strand:- start:3390 stop:3704 length:315 start_codon:yes stop_codon:yes gene_type:complete